MSETLGQFFCSRLGLSVESSRVVVALVAVLVWVAVGKSAVGVRGEALVEVWATPGRCAAGRAVAEATLLAGLLEAVVAIRNGKYKLK